MPHISTPDAILRIKKLIENKQGDEGRLRYISESLQKGKQLFHSDQIYLNKKISADVIPIQKLESTEPDEKIKDVKRLIALNFFYNHYKIKKHFTIVMNITYKVKQNSSLNSLKEKD
jgi:hypothetical protein